MAEVGTHRGPTLAVVGQTLRGFNPLRATWWLFGNLRWGIALIAFLAAVSLLGVLLPQIPPAMRGDPLAEAAWVEIQRDSFGFLTDWMYRVGLFDIFHARWFAVALGLLVASSAVYVLGRFPAVWWTVTRPRKRVADSYFRTAPQRASFLAGEKALAGALRRRWYAVETFAEGETTYLFADRFRWAEMGTILTHLSVPLFIVAAVVSRTSGFSADLFIGEGQSAPVFQEVARADQMQVQVIDAVGTFNERGQPLDYRSQLAIFQGGEMVKRCTATVNSPCSYGGYRFHQAAYFGFGAEVQVRDLASGNVIYRETLALADTMPGPHVIIRDAEGRVLLDQTLVLTETLGGAYGRLVTLAGGRLVWIGVRQEEDDWRLLVLEPSGRQGSLNLSLPRGGRAQGEGLSVHFVGLSPVPANFEADFPLPPGVPAGDSAAVLVQMANAVYGSGDASAGTAVAVPQGLGPPQLTIVGLAPQPLVLEPGQSAEIAGYQYTFLGQRDFAGIEVKKDRSDLLIWVASGLLLTGLFLTFWVPRRRLWVKITPGRTYLASQGGHPSGFRREVAQLARTAGAGQVEIGKGWEDERA